MTQKTLTKEICSCRFTRPASKYWDFTGSSVVLWATQLKVQSLCVPDSTGWFTNPSEWNVQACLLLRLIQSESAARMCHMDDCQAMPRCLESAEISPGPSIPVSWVTGRQAVALNLLLRAAPLITVKHERDTVDAVGTAVTPSV